MKMSGGIEPQMELHLSPNYPPIATSPDVNVRLQRVRLPKRSPKELDIHLIMEPRMSFVVRKLPLYYPFHIMIIYSYHVKP